MATIHTPSALTTTTTAALTSEQREALETILNGRGMGWTVRITAEKVTYLKGGEEVFSLWSSVSTCERVICHWNMTVGDDLDQRAMDAVVRCRKLSPAMKDTIEVAFSNANVTEAIVKTGKTFLDVYAWGAEQALTFLDAEYQEWDEDEIRDVAFSSLDGDATEAQIEFVAAGLHANRAASEGRVLEALATLR